jgi:hypothetical protein
MNKLNTIFLTATEKKKIFSQKILVGADSFVRMIFLLSPKMRKFFEQKDISHEVAMFKRQI